MLFSLLILFIGVCFSRSSTAGRNEILNYDMNEVKASFFRDGGAYQGEFQGSCSVSRYSNSSTYIMGPTWNPNLIIVSQVAVPTGQSLTSVGFYVTAINSNFNLGLVDILVYNSTLSGTPGVLAAKISQVNLTAFTNGTFSCLPLSNINTASNGLYWIGFYGQSGYGKSVISRATTNSGPNYYYQFINQSPVVGAGFPSNGYNTETNQLVMGVNFGQQSCGSLPCNSCTNSNNCVWCLSSESCIDSTSIPNCKSWTRNPSVCPVCAQYNTCNTCVGVPQCAWCLVNGQPSGCVLEVNDGNCTTAIREPGFCGL